MANVVGQRIKHARSDAKLTQQELAERLNVSRALIAQYESGLSLIPLDNLWQLHQIVDKPITYFFPEPGSGDLSPVTLQVAQVVEQLPVEERKRILDFVKYQLQKSAQQDE